jgi:hypothetical protein
MIVSVDGIAFAKKLELCLFVHPKVSTSRTSYSIPQGIFVTMLSHFFSRIYIWEDLGRCGGAFHRDLSTIAEDNKFLDIISSGWASCSYFLFFFQKSILVAMTVLRPNAMATFNCRKIRKRRRMRTTTKALS